MFNKTFERNFVTPRRRIPTIFYIAVFQNKSKLLQNKRKPFQNEIKLLQNESKLLPNQS